MKFEFKINGEVVTLKEFFNAINEDLYDDTLWYECIETGSATSQNGDIYQIVPDEPMEYEDYD